MQRRTFLQNAAAGETLTVGVRVKKRIPAEQLQMARALGTGTL